jgi:mannosylglycoprotein endo-beta-mannosidase
MECVKSATTSVLVKGSPIDEFRFGREFRQSDLLTPFLFFIAVEGLNVIMHVSMEANLFTCYFDCQKSRSSWSKFSLAICWMTHLIVGETSWANIRTVKALLILFELVSGLKVNLHKSMSYRTLGCLMLIWCSNCLMPIWCSLILLMLH